MTRIIVSWYYLFMLLMLAIVDKMSNRDLVPKILNQPEVIHIIKCSWNASDFKHLLMDFFA